MLFAHPIHARRAAFALALLALVFMAPWRLPANPADKCFYAGGSGNDTRFNCLLALSDGSVLIGGASASLTWLPAGVVPQAISATALDGSSISGTFNGGTPSGRTAFILRLSSDLSTVLAAAALPAGTAEEVRVIRASSLPDAAATGDLYISGALGKDTGSGQGGYFIGKLNRNFLAATGGTPTAFAWVFSTSASGDHKVHQPWDVGSDGKVVYTSGEPIGANWCALYRRKADGAGNDVVPNWRIHATTANGEWHGSPAAAAPSPATESWMVLKWPNRGALRSFTWDDYERLCPDGHGGWRHGTYPLDSFYSIPFNPAAPTSTNVGPGVTGYSLQNATARVGGVCVDRRDNSFAFGFSHKTTLPDGQPDFEPTVQCCAADGTMRSWSRLYSELRDQPVGLARTTDQGTTYTFFGTGLPPNISSLAATADGSTLFAGSERVGLWRYRAQTGWRRVQTGPISRKINAVACDPANPSLVLAANNNGGVFRSVDQGETFSTLAAGALGAGNATSFLFTGGGVVYASKDGGGGVQKSTDSGATWAASSTGLTNTTAYALAHNTAVAGELYVGTDGGVFRSTNSGGNWSAVNTGLSDLNVRAVAVRPGATAQLAVGTDGGGVFRSTTAGAAWAAITTDTALAQTDAVLFDPANPNVLYAGTRGSSSNRTSSLWRTNTAAAGWANIAAALGSARVQALLPDPASSGTGILAATDGRGLVSTPDQYIDGLAVDYSRPLGPQAAIIAIARCHGNNTTNFWAGNSIPASINPAHPGTSYHNQFTGSDGNAHLSYIARMQVHTGNITYASYNAEYAEGATGLGAAYADPNLDGWPSHNAGWPTLNTTKMNPTLHTDAAGKVYVLGRSGRRTLTTANAYQKMVKPAAGKSCWNSYVRTYTSDFTSLAYSSLIVGAWDTATEAGGDNTELYGLLPTGDGVLVCGWQDVDTSAVPLGNNVPTQNAAAWGGATPTAGTAIIARLSFGGVPVHLSTFSAE